MFIIREKLIFEVVLRFSVDILKYQYDVKGVGWRGDVPANTLTTKSVIVRSGRYV